MVNVNLEMNDVDGPENSQDYHASNCQLTVLVESGGLRERKLQDQISSHREFHHAGMRSTPPGVEKRISKSILGTTLSSHIPAAGATIEKAE